MNASFPMYGNVTFNINITVPPNHGTSSQMNPHDYLEATRLAFGLPANGLTNPAQPGGQGMFNASHFQQPPPGPRFAPSGNGYSDIASLTSQVGEMHLNDYAARCQTTDFSHYGNFASAGTQFQSLQTPETPRWLPSGSWVSQSPLSYHGELPPTDASSLWQEGQYSDQFNASFDFTPGPETPKANSLGLFLERESDQAPIDGPPSPTASEMIAETLRARSPSVAELIERTFRNGEPNHLSYDPYDTPCGTPSFTTDYSSEDDNLGYQTPVSSDWESSADSVLQTPDTGLLDFTQSWDASSTFNSNYPTAKTPGLDASLNYDWLSDSRPFGQQG